MSELRKLGLPDPWEDLKELKLKTKDLEQKLEMAVEALQEVEDLKTTVQKLIEEKPNRDWVIETDFDKWRSVKAMREALNKIRGEN